MENKGVTDAGNSNLKKDLGENDIIQKCIGSFGKWHLFVCLITFLIKFPVAFHQLNIVVLAPKVNFWCEDQNIPRCSANCSKHVFDRSIFTDTITMEWDLVCEKKYLESVAQTLTMLGILSGSFIFGYLSDKYGRKKPLVLAGILQLIAGVVSAFVPWLPLFFALRFLTSFATGGTMVTSFVLVMEIVGVKWRTVLGILYQVPFNFGHLLIPVISYFLRDWHDFQIAISVPSAVFITYIWLLPESPRWLLAVRKTEAAVSTMRNAAKWNCRSTELIEYEVKEYLAEKHANDNVQTKTGNIADLLRTPIIRKYTVVLWLNWLFCGLSFYGSSQYIGQLGGDIFLNIAISAVVQIPGVLFCSWSVGAWGRKTSLIISNICCGVLLIATGFVPEPPYWIKPTLASLGISCSMMSFATVYIYAGEVFPTVVRNIGLGSSSTFARIGSMIAPFIANLSATNSWIPPSVFGASMLVGAILCFVLPETLNCKLPDSIEEVEEFEKQKKKTDSECA